MADADTTATADKNKSDEALEDPGMAEFLRNKEAGKESAVEDTKESEGDADATAETEETTAESTEDESSEPGETKAEDGSTAKKEQNRLGYQLRQIRAGDPFVSRARKALQDEYVNVEGITDDQREIRQIKSDNYLEKLERDRAQLVADGDAIAAEYDYLNPQDEAHFDKPLYDYLMAKFGRDSLIMSDPDENGKTEIVGYRTRLLDYIREEADLIARGSKGNSGKTESAKTAVKLDKGKTEAQMDAASDEPGGTSTAKADNAKDNDPLVAAFISGMDSVK